MRAWFSVLVLGVVACSGSKRSSRITPKSPIVLSVSPSGPKKPAPRHYELEPMRIEVIGRSDDGQPQLVAFDARSLLDGGNSAFAEGHLDDALNQYRKLVEIFPDSEFVRAALFNVGLVHERRQDYELAIRSYQKLATEHETTRDAVDANIRIGALRAEMRQWGKALAVLETLLIRTDLSVSDRMEAMVRLGYVLCEQKNYPRAEDVLKEAIGYYTSAATAAYLETDYFLAMSHYYLGQIPHRQAISVPLRVDRGDPQLKRDITRKAELLLVAYERYFRAVRVRNPYWATAAGYQMSQMYKEFWDAIVSAPVPKDLTGKKVAYYREALHERALVFLKKALHGHSQNIEMAKVFRTATEWSVASEKRAQEIANILEQEAGGQLHINHIN